MTDDYSLEELLPIVAQLSRKYTLGESTSITYDKARQLMGAVQYTIGIFKESVSTETNILDTRSNISAQEAYEMGFEMLCKKVKVSQDKYNRLISNFISYENDNYRDTVEKGIPAFFLYYDSKFNPEDTVITMDYPVIGGLENKQGILAMEEYIEKIELEQIFLGQVSVNYCYDILREYQTDYKKQFYNICSIILRRLIVQILTGNQNPINIKNLDEYLKSKARDEVQKKLCECVHIMVEQQYDKNKKLEKYLMKDIPDFVIEMYINSENHCLERCFHIDKNM